LGWPSVEWGLKNISSKELSEWMAYYCIDPFGQEREDFRMGQVCSTVANSNRSKNSKVFSPEDFIPKFDKPKVQSWQSILQTVEMLNVRLHGEDTRGGNSDS
jgi:hypothetical protein